MRINKGEFDRDWTIELLPLSQASDLTNLDKLLFEKLESVGTVLDARSLQTALVSSRPELIRAISLLAVQEGYVSATGSNSGIVGCGWSIVTLFGSIALVPMFGLPTVLVGILAAVGVLAILASNGSPLSPSGQQLRSHLLGVRQYLASSSQRYGELQSDLSLYDRLLPYAYAFGLGRTWTSAYEGLGVETPYWVNGSFDDGVFWASALVDDFAPPISYESQSGNSSSWGSMTGDSGSGNWASNDSGFGDSFSSDTSSSFSFDSGSSWDSGSSFDSGGSVDSGGGGGGGD